MSDPVPPSEGEDLVAPGGPEPIEPAADIEPLLPEITQDLEPPAFTDQAAEASLQAAEGQAPVQASLPDRQVEELPTGKGVVARYGVVRSVGLFQHDLEGPLRVGTKVVVRSERGLELAEVLTNVTDAPAPGGITRDQLTEHLRIAGSEYPFHRKGRLLRLANDQDLIDQRHLAGSACEEAQYCRKQIRELRLDMKLVTVEHLLGGERIIFYFTAENRVDFRELVRRLANQFRTRIEMRQVARGTRPGWWATSSAAGAAAAARVS